MVLKEEQFNAILSQLKALQESLNIKSAAELGETYIDSSTVIKQLGISQRTFQTWRDKKIISYHMIGAKIFIKRAEIDRLMEAHHIKRES